MVLLKAVRGLPESSCYEMLNPKLLGRCNTSMVAYLCMSRDGQWAQHVKARGRDVKYKLE